MLRMTQHWPACRSILVRSASIARLVSKFRMLSSQRIDRVRRAQCSSDGVGQQLEYDLGSGQTSSLVSYVGAGVKGAGQGALVGASLAYLGPAGTLRAYGYYETANNIYNFGEMVVRHPSQYTKDQKLGATNSLYTDLGSRTISAALPREYRIIYDSLRTIYDSVQRVGTQLSQLQNQQQSRASQPRPQGASGGGGGSSLPSTVTQNGITYVRNSSGLLNFAPTR
jgi:hypothetical protein